MSEYLLEHPSMGPIRGIAKTETVIQYLGIQYASLKDRFSRGELMLHLPANHARRHGKILDATKSGPSPLLPINACKDHQSAIVQKHLPIKEWEQSDIDGLTLDINVPKLDSVADLPVFVLVYGGGFTSGSAEYPEYDLTRITQMSVEMGMPMISIGFNYRVGVPGFLYSSAMKDSGYKPNNGLDDQRLAFRWIKHNIAGFGGNPKLVTFVGESAGAIAGWFHLQSPEPLFHQIVAMSGSSFLRPRPLALLEKGFDLAITEFDVKDLPPTEQVKKLLEIPRDDFVARLGRKIPVGPFMDGELVGKPSTFEELIDKDNELADTFPALRHCKRLIMGDCQMDGMGFHSRVKGRTDILPTTLAKCLETVFDPIDTKIAPAIVSAYKIDIFAESNSTETTKACLDFAADVSFALPARYLTAAWASSSVPGSNAYLYHFNCPNPWEGPWKGYAMHAMDLIFALQNYREYLSVGQQKCSERFAKDIITFINGADPWPVYDPQKAPGAMVYYAPMEGERDESEFAPTSAPERTGRTNFLVDLVGESLLDKLIEACQMFLVGPLK